MALMRICLCGHDAADHHLDRMAVYCLGDLMFVLEEPPELEHCGCTVYEPVRAARSLRPA